jgi:NADPH-dependent glutamate synthase beta subunit-like oxidoreductase
MPEEGYSPLAARMEAARCLMCEDAPCTCDCPAGVDARGFIQKIRFDNLEGAVRALKRCNVLAASCARICPTGSLCGKGCTAKGLAQPIDIAGLQAYVMDWERKRGMIEPVPSRRDGARVAIIGAGPAGLACAAELAVGNHAVDVFEREAAAGGMLRHCIPAFRLPTEILDFEQAFLEKLGIAFHFDAAIDDPRRLLGEGFQAVFIATGLDRPQALAVSGGELPGVHQALALLRAAKRGEALSLGRRVVVIGGGDTALDAARVARRAGSECFVLYRRAQAQMPAYEAEIDAAWDEGVEFYFRTIVHGIVGTDRAAGVRCVRVRWRDKVVGLPQAYEVEGTEWTLACDAVVIAVGQGPSATFGLRTTPNGLLAVETERMATEAAGIFAGGDLAAGGGTAARAIGQGKAAAVAIAKYVTGDS